MSKLDQRFWYGLIALATVVELDAVRAKRQDGTLSHAMRLALHTQTRTGRILTRCAVVATASWLLPHLCQQVAAEMDAA